MKKILTLTTFLFLLYSCAQKRYCTLQSGNIIEVDNGKHEYIIEKDSTGNYKQYHNSNCKYCNK